MSKVYIALSDVCSRRLIEIKKIYNYFILNGHEVVTDIKKAEYVFLYVCGFDKCTQNEAVRRIKELNLYRDKLVIAGCFPNINVSRVKEIFDGPIIKHGHEEDLDSLFSVNTEFQDVGECNLLYKKFKHNNLVSFSERFLEKIKMLKSEPYCIQVGTGCLHRCSYCVDKLTVGTLKSKPMSKIIDEFSKGLRDGYKRFLLTADDFGAYGQDIGTNFVELLDKLTSHEGDYTINLEEINAYWLIKYGEEFSTLIRDRKGKIPFCVLAFQSSSDRILKLMGRGYTSSQLLSLLEKLKDKILLECHIIVGFPTETESDFMPSINLINKGYFNSGNVFIYSDMEEAPSASLFPKVPECEKRRRLDITRNTLLRSGYSVYYRNKNNLVFQKGKQGFFSVVLTKLSNFERVI